jgi:hypothetical protein
MSPAPSRRRLLTGGLVASSALLLGAVRGPPVRPPRPLSREPDPDIADEIDRVGSVFRRGLDAGFRAKDDARLHSALNAEAPVDRGVAWEGAAMAAAFLERGTKSPRSWRSLVASTPEHRVPLALGLGWALSWLGAEGRMDGEPLPPLVAGRVLDGYGFRDGFVETRRFLLRREPPPHVAASSRAVWLEGLGRSLWYVAAGDMGTATPIVRAFDPPARPFLWKGLGVGATYVGGFDPDTFGALRDAAGADRGWVAAGSALAARSRRDEGVCSARIEAPCAVLAGLGP